MPSVFVASAEFVQAARLAVDVARVLRDGAVFTPHPIQDRTDDEMRAYAEAAYDEIVAAVTT